MDVAYLSALSAIAGSLVGGLTSGFTTWLSQRSQARAGQLARKMSRRDELTKSEAGIDPLKDFSEAALHIGFHG